MTHACDMFLFTIMFLLMFPLGMGGQHRRIWDYTNPDGFRELVDGTFLGYEFQDIRQFITYCLLVLIASQFVFFYNVIKSLRSGKKAEKNPWRANTLEWLAPNVPPHGNFPDGLPEVYRPPYEYSVPGRAEDYWPQYEPEKQPSKAENIT